MFRIFLLLLTPGLAFGADYYVSTTGTNSGTCGSVGSPCATVQYAIDNRATTSGDRVVVNSGTYTEDVTFGSGDDDITVTTTDAVISALGSFTRGIPSGTDNRPLFTGTFAFNGGTGNTIEYLRIRYAATPQSGFGVCAVEARTPSNTVQYSELYNGTAICIFSIGPYTFSQLYMHDSGVADGDEPDTHTVFFCRNVGCGGEGGADASSWAQVTLIEQCTFGGDSDGDQIQMSTGDDASGYDNYIEISNCDFTGTVDEQMIDSKGANYVKVHDNTFTSTTGNSDISLSSPIDFVAGDLESTNWWIYNNIFRPAVATYQCINMAHGSSEDFFWIWNNIFYNCSAYAWTTGDQRAVGTWNGSPAHLTFVHNTVYGPSVTANVVWAWMTSEDANTVITNNAFYNVFQTSSDDGAISTRRGDNATVTYNYFNVSSCPSGSCTNGTNSVINSTDPFTNAAGGDYSPSSGSASIVDAGYTGLSDSGFYTPSLDFNGNSRDSSPDIGAIEYGAGPAVEPQSRLPNSKATRMGMIYFLAFLGLAITMFGKRRSIRHALRNHVGNPDSSSVRHP